MQSHSTEAHGLAPASLSQRAPALRPSGDRLWLIYCRMIGLPGTVCICLAAILHQLECKLRHSAMVPVNTCNAMASAALLGSQLGVEAVAVVFALSVTLCIAANLTVNRATSFESDNARQVSQKNLIIPGVALVYLGFWHQTLVDHFDFVNV